MALSKKTKIEILALVIIFVLIVVVLYFTFFRSRGDIVLPGMGGGSTTPGEDPLVKELSSIKTQVLNDAEFEALIQFSSLPVTPGDRGIANPFGG